MASNHANGMPERDDLYSNRHPGPAYCSSTSFFAKPVPILAGHALTIEAETIDLPPIGHDAETGTRGNLQPACGVADRRLDQVLGEVVRRRRDLPLDLRQHGAELQGGRCANARFSDRGGQSDLELERVTHKACRHGTREAAVLGRFNNRPVGRVRLPGSQYILRASHVLIEAQWNPDGCRDRCGVAQFTARQRLFEIDKVGVVKLRQIRYRLRSRPGAIGVRTKANAIAELAAQLLNKKHVLIKRFGADLDHEKQNALSRSPLDFCDLIIHARRTNQPLLDKEMPSRSAVQIRNRQATCVRKRVGERNFERSNGAWRTSRLVPQPSKNLGTLGQPLSRRGRHDHILHLCHERGQLLTMGRVGRGFAPTLDCLLTGYVHKQAFGTFITTTSHDQWLSQRQTNRNGLDMRDAHDALSPMFLVLPQGVTVAQCAIDRRHGLCAQEFSQMEITMNGSLTRRDLLQALLAVSAGPLLARSNAALAASNDIVAASFSGVWQEGLKAGPIGCYKAKNGGDVALVFGTPSDFTQKIMATRSHPAIDVIIGTDADVFQNAQLGIIEKMDPAKVPNLTGILPIFKDPYEGWAFGYDGGRDGVALNTSKIRQAPKTWIEFVERVAKGEFGRAVMYPHLTATDGLAVTWLLNRELGGNLQDPSPAIKRIREMKPYVTKFYTSNAEPGTALTSGEVRCCRLDRRPDLWCPSRGAQQHPVFLTRTREPHADDLHDEGEKWGRARLGIFELRRGGQEPGRMEQIFPWLLHEQQGYRLPSGVAREAGSDLFG